MLLFIPLVFFSFAVASHIEPTSTSPGVAKRHHGLTPHRRELASDYPEPTSTRYDYSIASGDSKPTKTRHAAKRAPSARRRQVTQETFDNDDSRPSKTRREAAKRAPSARRRQVTQETFDNDDSRPSKTRREAAKRAPSPRRRQVTQETIDNDEFEPTPVRLAKRVSPAPRRRRASYETNAKRLARGLPPLPPAPRRRHHDSQGHSDGKHTGVLVSRRDNTVDGSAHGEKKSFVGRVQVLNSGKILGFLAKHSNSSGLYYVDDISKASSITFNATTSGVTSHIDIIDLAEDRTATPNIGGIITRGHNLRKGSGKFALVSGVEPVRRGQPAMRPTSGNRYDVESAIWMFDSDNRMIQAQWINYDHSSQDTEIYYDSRKSNLALVGDGDEYVKSHPGAVAVMFNLV